MSSLFNNRKWQIASIFVLIFRRTRSSSKHYISALIGTCFLSPPIKLKTNEFAKCRKAAYWPLCRNVARILYYNEIEITTLIAWIVISSCSRKNTQVEWKTLEKNSLTFGAEATVASPGRGLEGARVLPSYLNNPFWDFSDQLTAWKF